jgi:sec-independent protein translocase protein TatB
MFGIGFGEIVLIAVVALLVLGPERLPKAARFAGLWMRRARAQWESVKAELENELVSEELRRTVRQAHSDLNDSLHATRESIRFTSADRSPSEHVTIKPAATKSAAIEPLEIETSGQAAAPSDDRAQTTIAQFPHDSPASDIARPPRWDAGSADG